MFCEKCGAENKDNAKFCEKCGAPIPEAPPTKTEQANQSAVQIHKKQIIAGSIILLVILACVIGFLVYSNSQKQAAYTGKLQTADKYLQELDYEHAEAVYLEAIDIQPKKEEAYIKLADVYVTQGKTDKAIKILEKGKKKAGSKAVDTKLTELSTAKERGSEQYQAYYDLCMEYQEKYGRPGYRETEGWDGVSLTGLCTIKLFDFDQDGNEELILVYVDKDEFGDDSFFYEIWAWQNRECVNILPRNNVSYDQDIDKWIEVVSQDGVIYLVDDDSSGNVQYLRYQDGKFVTAHKQEEVVSTDGTDLILLVDGTETKWDDLEQATSGFPKRRIDFASPVDGFDMYYQKNEEDDFIIPFNFILQETANQVLNESAKTLQSLND